MAVGDPTYQAAAHLGSPTHLTRRLIPAGHAKLTAAGTKEQFHLAVEALADQLDTTHTLIDYGRRRDAMRGWTLTPDNWTAILDELPDTAAIGRCWRAPDVTERKRQLASAWLWTRATHGDVIFSPQNVPTANGSPTATAISATTSSTNGSTSATATEPTAGYASA